MPNYRATSDHDWMRYLNLLGFQVDQVDENAPPSGHRLFCAVSGKVGGKEIPHAIAVDESAESSTPPTARHSPASSRSSNVLRTGHSNPELLHCPRPAVDVALTASARSRGRLASLRMLGIS